jgi:peptidoglycan hydrolase-like protein with peptidoglycan-binding domain
VVSPNDIHSVEQIAEFTVDSRLKPVRGKKMTTRHHNAKSIARRWGYGLSVVCLTATAAVAGIAAPAHAATPACDTWGWQWPRNESATTLKLPVDTDLGIAYGEWRCTMRQTNHGDDVWTLQEGLNLCYGTTTGRNLGINLLQDGQFGPATKAALIKVQRHHGISADGVYGPQTARTILHKGRATTPYGVFDVCNTTAQIGMG